MLWDGLLQWHDDVCVQRTTLGESGISLTRLSMSILETMSMYVFSPPHVSTYFTFFCVFALCRCTWVVRRRPAIVSKQFRLLTLQPEAPCRALHSHAALHRRLRLAKYVPLFFAESTYAYDGLGAVGLCPSDPDLCPSLCGHIYRIAQNGG
jgi:hypothetical protein